MVNMGELFKHRRIGDIEMERVLLNERNPERDLLKPNDLLFARQSIVAEGAGQVSIFLGAGEPVTFESHLIRARIDETKADPVWLFHFFESPQGRALMRSIVTQVAAAGIRGSDLARLSVRCPPLEEQSRVATLLRGLDDKIESNRRLANLLEEAAATEFRAHFVDFVRGDHSDDTASGRLAELAVLVKQMVEPRETPMDSFEHFSIGAFDGGDGPETTTGDQMLSGKTLLPGGDSVLVSKLNPRTKRVWWPRPLPSARAVCSPEFLVLAPRDHVPTSYLYGVASADETFYEDLLSRVTGTTGSRQRVRPADAMDCRVVVPTAGSMAEWDEFARPIYDRAHATLAESRTLEQLRDALLPKLISGEIRVPDTADPKEVIGPAVEGTATV